MRPHLLMQIGQEVHEGIRLEFAHKGNTSSGSNPATSTNESNIYQGGSDSGQASGSNSKRAGGGEDSRWYAGLDALSGGQRTMVCLTFVVAVSGGKPAAVHPRHTAAHWCYITPPCMPY